MKLLSLPCSEVEQVVTRWTDAISVPPVNFLPLMLYADQVIFPGRLRDVKTMVGIEAWGAVMEIIHKCANLVQKLHARAFDSTFDDIDLVWEGRG